MRVVLVLVLALLAPATALGDSGTLQDVPAEEIAAVRWRFLTGATAGHRFGAHIDGGGRVSASEIQVGAGARVRFTPGLSLRMQVSYEHVAYDFSGSSGLGALDPWNDVHTIGLGSTLTARLGERWQGYAGLRVKASGEAGADLADAITAGGLAGVSYRLGERLTVGAGFTISQRLEDPPSLSPLLSVIWSITETLTLRVGSVGGGGAAGGGVEFEWQALPELELALGLRNQSREFRLDDRGVAPGGVGQDRARLAYARAAWKIVRNVELSALGGMALMGSLRIEDRRGHELRDEDYDPAPFVSLRLAVGF